MRILQNQTKRNLFAKLSIVAILVVFGLTVAVGVSAERIDNTAKTARPSSKPTPARRRARKADASKYQVPRSREMREMTRAALLDFNEAVAAGDFTDFHSKISKIWQKQTTPEQFNEVFGEFIAKEIDISEISSSQPIYNPKPTVRRDGGAKKLIAEGCYDVNPRPVKFVLKWIPEGKAWKLFGIEVDTTVETC